MMTLHIPDPSLIFACSFAFIGIMLVMFALETAFGLIVFVCGSKIPPIRG